MQLAIELFSALAPQGATAEDLPPTVGYQRNNIFIDINDLSLSARRAIDVLYFIAAQDSEIHKLYQLDLEFFRWLMSYTSNNRQHLQKILREGQKAAIQVQELDERGQENGRWVSIPLLGPVGISKGQIHFQVADLLQHHIKNPETSHFLSLRYTFRSIHAKIIYDHIQPFVEEGVTPWYTLDEFRAWFGFQNHEYVPYKKLSERVVLKSIKLINQNTNLQISHDTLNLPGVKTVGQIRFRVRKNAEGDNALSSMLVLKEQYHVLRHEFGFSAEQINEVIANRSRWDERHIQDAIDYSRHQLNEGKIKTNPAGYLMKAIREGYILGEATKKLISLRNAASGDTGQRSEAEESLAKANFDAARKVEVDAAAGFAKYQSLSATEQAQALADFAKTLGGKRALKRLNLSEADLAEHAQRNPAIQKEVGLFCYTAKRARATSTKP
jgi:hypothetical protein